MAHQILTSLLFLAGIILSLGVVVIYLFDFKQSEKPLYLLPVVVAVLFGYTQVSNLLYESSILACAIVPDSTLLLSGVVSLLFLLMMIYGFSAYRKICAGKAGCGSELPKEGEGGNVQ